MILNTGSRTDIPAYYSEWFFNRIREGYVLVRNPYYPAQVTKYFLNPEVIDVMVFCTKNPLPMLDKSSVLETVLSGFDTFWFVTITPYETDIEPFVPEKEQVMDSFQRLSKMTGKQRISWRYDPIFITEKYSVDYHIKQFSTMSKFLSAYTSQCVVSFIDLYEKTKKNFRNIRSVTRQEQEQLITAFSEIAKENEMQIHLCCENVELTRQNVDADGCMSKSVLEKALGCKLDVPQKKMARKECSCLLGADIGVYNTCGHGCLYCYANYDRTIVISNMKNHNPLSPFLIGGPRQDDIVKEAVQKSWKNRQLDVFDFI
ncbi:MAG: DUF1848 domain-containing protein [Lachnospiraceae bacterium]|nr:DUF1848 domain-containing protein [Lachnospiraceae bacterium]